EAKGARTAVGPEDEASAGKGGPGGARAVAGEGAAQEARRMPLEPSVGEAPSLERAQPESVDENVGLSDQAGEDFLSRRNRHVERQRALVAVDAEEVDGLAGDEGRSPVAGIVAFVRRLAFDDLGAHVAEHHRAD